LNEAIEDVLAYSYGKDFVNRYFPPQHWKKVWNTNFLEGVNEELKRRTRLVDIYSNDAAIIRLVGAVLLEQDKQWQLEGRMFSVESMADIPELENLSALFTARGRCCNSWAAQTTPAHNTIAIGRET
jgi:putative transposase